MAIAKRHLGHGTWVVERDGVRVAGPMSKEAAESKATELATSPVPATKPASAASPRFKTEREYQRWLSDCINQPLNDEHRELVALLSKRRDEDEVRILMQQFAPMLKAGKEAGRRERVKYPPIKVNPTPQAN